MAHQITANDLKVKGVTAIDDNAIQNGGLVVTVRGKEKYVILSIEEYNTLREYELEVAINEAKKDIKAGTYKKGTVAAHMKRLENV